MPTETTNTESPLSKLLTGSVILFIGLALELMLSFLTRVVIARYLGPSGYGTIALGIITLTSLSTIVLLGTKNGVARYLPRYEDLADQRGVVISAFQLVLPVGIVTGFVLFLLSGHIATRLFHAPETAPVFRAVSVAVPFVVFLKLTIGVSQGRQQSHLRVLVQNLILPLAQLGFIAFTVIAGLQTAGVSWAYFGAYGFVAGFCIIYLMKYTPFFNGKEYVGKHRELLFFSLPLMTVGIMELVFEQLDTFLIGYFATVEAVGVYNSVYPIAFLLTTTLVSFRFLAMPILSGLHADEKRHEMHDLFQTVAIWILITTVPFLFAIGFYPTLIISLTFGPEYRSGAAALSILTVGFSTHAIAGLTGATLTSIGRTRTIMADNALVALVNLALNLVLIPSFPLLGAATATAVAYALLNFLFAYQLYKSTGIHPFSRRFAKTGLLSVLFIIAGYLGSLQLSPITGTRFFLFFALWSALYFGSVIRYIEITAAEEQLADHLEAKLPIAVSWLKHVVRLVRK